jgi:hypothetical protein
VVGSQQGREHPVVDLGGEEPPDPVPGKDVGVGVGRPLDEVQRRGTSKPPAMTNRRRETAGRPCI